MTHLVVVIAGGINGAYTTGTFVTHIILARREVNDDERLNSHPPRRRIADLEHQVKATPVVGVLALLILVVVGLIYGFSPPVIFGLILIFLLLVALLLIEHFYGV